MFRVVIQNSNIEYYDVVFVWYRIEQISLLAKRTPPFMKMKLLLRPVLKGKCEYEAVV
jgi:hypothetical protein